MKKILLVVMSCLNFILQAELLVVVKDGGKFRALTQAESIKYQAQINAVKEKYQWPMCVKEDLTPEEIAEYLKAGKPYAEEQFVQKKLREAINPSEIDLQVMFVPTSIYEMFCLSELSEIETHNSVQMYATELKLSQGSNPQESKDLLRSEFIQYNNLFNQAKQGKESLSSKMNRQLTAYIFENYPELQQQSDILTASNALKRNIEGLKSMLCNKIIAFPCLFRGIKTTYLRRAKHNDYQTSYKSRV